ncbi:putative serpin-Z5 [Lolium rigidum]|uniref:putative serpin-Z5 n=1 Tax=Lolium rigidum TaxID=89674 RepID=UPI001F5E22E9|nr:putative serpin-Z5 [Lolium rigidum]
METTATTTSTTDNKQLACLGLTTLALRLLNELAETSASSNLVFSPLSIYTALALTAAGARGATLQELLLVLGARSRDELAEIVLRFAKQILADRSPTGGPRVLFACGVWHDETRKLKPAFRDAAAQFYKAETRAVDFRKEPGEAVKVINAWAAAATSNLIEKMLHGPVPNQTDIIVANAIYFKGMWDVPFRKECTEDDKFHRLDGSTFDVPFMRSGAKQYIACHQGFKVLKLPYKKGSGRYSSWSSFSMCVFLPDARDGLTGLISMMASSSADFLREHLPTSLVSVRKFKLPRFKLSFSGDDMPAVLRRLGLQVAFNETNADLRDMVEEDGTGRPLALGKIIHKAVIEVNEEGTEAAAVTACMKVMRSAPPKLPVDFVADHPFVFFVIHEKSGAIVFAGTVLEPTPSMPGKKLLHGGRVQGDENANRSVLSSLHHYLRSLFG